MADFRILALYQFVTLDDPEGFRNSLHSLCLNHHLTGTLLVAREGLNGTVCGHDDAIEVLLTFLDADGRFGNLSLKESRSESCPFLRMKVRLKQEIVTLGVPGTDPNKRVGQYVDPKDWNALISRPEVTLIDTRNDYEVEIGTFKKALNPKTTSFRDFPTWVTEQTNLKKTDPVAMFCTGGIRCEKGTAYLLDQGFTEVYHLNGGILKYLEKVPEQDSLWDGECFVFDDRVSVDHSLKPGSYDMCHGCRCPLSMSDKASEHTIRGVCCPRCYRDLTEAQKKSFSERQKQIDLAAERQELHLGRIV